jgi:DNA-binding MarR family transcriptional regulator
MQVLAHTSKAVNSTPAAGSGAVDPAGCAHAMLDGMPPVMWFIRTQMRKHRTHGLSVPQYRALCLLDRFPTASLSHVADHLGSSQPSASRLIQGLVTRGLVARKECKDDRRQVKLVLTPRGKTLQAASHQATQARLAEAIAHLPEADRRTIVEAMHLLTDVFDFNRKA